MKHMKHSFEAQKKKMEKNVDKWNENEKLKDKIKYQH